MNDDATRPDAPVPDTSRHTLSVEEAAALFAAAGIPKSIRTIQRYCRANILDCIRTDTELGDKYLIDRPSVDRRIDELKRFQEMLAATPVATRRDTTRPDASRHDVSRNDATRRDNAGEGGGDRLKELEATVLNLRIDNRAKELVITQLVEERKGFFTQLTEQATRIGELSTRLRQLLAPGASGPAQPPPPDVTPQEGEGAFSPRVDNSPSQNLGQV